MYVRVYVCMLVKTLMLELLFQIVFVDSGIGSAIVETPMTTNSGQLRLRLGADIGVGPEFAPAMVELTPTVPGPAWRPNCGPLAKLYLDGRRDSIKGKLGLGIRCLCCCCFCYRAGV